MIVKFRGGGAWMPNETNEKYVAAKNALWKVFPNQIKVFLFLLFDELKTE